MKILLVLPAAAHVRIRTREQQVPQRAMLRFSVLPLLAVAALTPEGHELAICDENVECLDLDSGADLIGISFMTAVASRAYDIASSFRARGRIVVGGGYHPTLMPDDAAPHFDALVLGDAEGAWQELLHDAARGRLRKIYRSTAAELVQIPVPRRDLLARTSRYYATVNAVQASKGCRHACSYCSIAAFHKSSYRKRPASEVVRELQTLSRDFIFVDDNIVSEPEYAKELFCAMVPLKKRWVAQCSIRISDDPELLQLARRAGCRGLFIGIETLNEKNLQSVGKGFNEAGAYLQRINRIRRAGIGIVAGIIVGMDQDDPGVFERTLRFLEESRTDCVQVNIMTPLPGTPLFEAMKKSGRIASFDWEHYDFRHCVFYPAGMTRVELQAGADWMYRRFYRLDRILLRALRALFEAGPVPALLGLKLGLAYRYDNIREGITGWNPAVRQSKNPDRAPRLPLYRSAGSALR